MATCELCGSTSSKLFDVKIAGSVVKTCAKCKSLGKSIEKEKQLQYSFRHKQKNQINEEVVPNYSSLINSQLNKKELNLHQLARILNIKESTLNKYMQEKVKLDVETAKRIQKYLEITLVSESSSKININEYLSDNDEQTNSLGDLIKKQLEQNK